MLRRTSRASARALGVAVTVALVLPVGAAGQSPDPPWDEDPAVEQRAQGILGQMSLEEKIDLVTGEVRPGFGFHNNGNARLGIPELLAQDGPVGVRIPGGNATMLPSGPALASTFDTDRAFQYGRILGIETHSTGANLMLGPTVDTLRSPFNPRIFETFSEDPLLTAELGAADARGIQSQPGVGATAKHYALNTQEHRRATVNAVVDERTLEELYLRPFEDVVREARPASVMCAFTSANGVDACSSRQLLTDILKGRMGFKGFVHTDFAANQQTVESANAGTDLDMPGVSPGENGATAITGSTVWAGKLLQAVRNGQVSEATIDDKVLRILRAMIGTGMFDVPPVNEPLPVAEHGQFARETSAAGTVLLKNERRMLPLTNRRFDSIAVIGSGTDVVHRGGGSALVTPTYEVTPLDAIRERAGDGVEVLTAEGVEAVGPATIFSGIPAVPRDFLAPPGGQAGEGLRGEYFNSFDLSGSPSSTVIDPIASRAFGFYEFFAPPVPGQPDIPRFPEPNSIRWTGTLTAPWTGTFRFALQAFGTVRVYLDGELMAETHTDRLGERGTRTFDLRLTEDQSRDIRIEYFNDAVERSFRAGSQVSFGWIHGPDDVVPRIREAAEVAAEADVAVVFAKTYESEGFIDRATLRLPNDQDQLIREVARRNPNTVVVLQTGGPVTTTEWDRAPKAILQNWFGGQEQGNAIADVLWGDVNPSGSLPITFPRSDRETPITFRNDLVQYPEVNDRTEYKEGVFIGYRGHEEFRIPARWPFGHGRSYTSFRYSGLQTPRGVQSPDDDEVQVRFRLANTGPRRGTEIAQVYVGKLPTDAVETAPKALAGWARATLDPGESRRVTVTLDRRAFQYWDADADKWVTPSGPVRIMVGASVANIRLWGGARLG